MRSFLMNAAELEIALDELQLNGNVVDVICLTEHFIKKGEECHLQLDNYRLATSYARKKKRGGSCILLREGIEHKELLEINKLAKNIIFECCAIELIAKNLIVICIYRNPEKINVVLFLKQLELLLDIVSRFRSKKMIICGDFNINTLEDNNYSRDFVNLLHSHNFTLEFNDVTRLESGTCVDNIAHNSRGYRGEILHLGISDHSALLLKCPVNSIDSKKFWFIELRDYNKDNLNKFKNCLKSINFDNLYSTQDANSAYDILHEIINFLYDLCFPFKKIKINTKIRPKWLTTGIKKSTKYKRRLYWTSLKTKDTKLFNTYKKILKKAIYTSKKIENNKYIKSASNTSKASWQIINKHKYRKPREHILKILSNNNYLCKPSDIANLFNDTFVDLTKKYPNNSNRYNYKIRGFSNSVYLTPTTPKCITKIIKNMKNTNSVGYDGISTKVIKYCSEELASPLSYIFNLCLCQGIFPEKLKITIIKPIFKKGNKEKCENYRPIALIPVIAKILERIIYNIIYGFLEKYNILKQEQYGFRKNKSTSQAIIDLLTTISESINNKDASSTIFMDMTKAFDFVSHKLLLGKLYEYGVRGPAYNLIESYLQNRQQETHITYMENLTEKVAKSNTRIVERGVPQGSILGPLLFILYINDLPEHVKQKIILFADDLSVVVRCTNLKEYESILNEALGDIIEWLEVNNLVVNIEKTKFMQFYLPQSRPKNLTINYNGQKIMQVNESKFLGITLDRHLNWKTHISNLTTKLSKYVYVLKHLTKITSRNTALCAYHAYVSSGLRYGILLWGNAALTHILPLFKTQKKCVRAMFGIGQRVSCVPYFRELKILTLPSLFIYEACIFVKQNPDKFSSVQTSYPRKARNNLVIRPKQLPNLQFYSNTVFVLGPKLFNKLPETIKTLNYSQFKIKLFNLLVTQCYYNIDDYLTDNIKSD